MSKEKMSKPIVLRGGWVIDPAQGTNRTADVLLADGVVKAIGPELAATDAEIVDCVGLWVVPGLIDAHCHLREPGFERKETLETGTRAAARGGFTTVVAMANLNPVPDNLNVYRRIQDLIAQKAVVRVVQAAGVTVDLKGRDLSDMATLAAEGVLIALVGWRLFGQRLDGWSIAGMALIIAGVLVMNLLSKTTSH